MAAYSHSQGHAAFITQHKLDKYNPELYSPEVQEELRNNLVMKNICGSKFKAGDFLHKGDKILVREEPIIRAKVYDDNTQIVYDEPESFWREFTLNKAAYWAFKVRDIHELFSDIAPFAPTWTKNVVRELAEQQEREFFYNVWRATQNHYRFDGAGIGATTVANSTIRHIKDGSGNDAVIYGGADAANQGNSAGAVSGAFHLGTDLDPVTVYRDKDEMSSGTETYKSLMPDLIADAEAVLHEQKGSEGLVDPWVVLPGVACNRIQTGEFKNASFSGAESLLRKSVNSIGDFSGFKVYRSNLLPVHTVTSAEAAAEGATVSEGDKVYTILFGDKTATSYVTGIDKQEILRDKDHIMSLHRSFSVYDYFVHYNERLGVIKVKFA